jgi:hypothetical protein
VYVVTDFAAPKNTNSDATPIWAFVDKKTNAYIAITGHGVIATRSARNYAMMSSKHYRHTNY